MRVKTIVIHFFRVEVDEPVVVAHEFCCRVGVHVTRNNSPEGRVVPENYRSIKK